MNKRVWQTFDKPVRMCEQEGGWKQGRGMWNQVSCPRGTIA